MVRTLVATCGNREAGDDAFGPRLGDLLRTWPVPGVEVVDLDIKPAALLDHLPGPDCLILVDAVRVPGSEAGRLVQIDLAREDPPVLLHDDAMSSHGLGLADQLALARELGLLPDRVWLVGAVVDGAGVGARGSGWMPALLRQARGRVENLAASVEV